MRQDTDYVNGMRCIVETWDSQSSSVVVRTDTGRRVAVSITFDDCLGSDWYYPIRPGYASTVMKLQSAELKHVTVWLDRPHVPAAAYTAMSRVKYQHQCLVGGRVTPDHFTPAC